MRRREFLGTCGAAVLWASAAGAQKNDEVRRIVLLTPLLEKDPQSTTRVEAFLKALQDLGWTNSRNARVEVRWGASDPQKARDFASELATRMPDVVVADGSTSLGELLQVSRKVPIVFVNVTDPVGGRFVESLARPAGNVTGFTLFEYAIATKWLELIKEISSNVSQVAVIFNPALTSGGGQLEAIRSAAPSMKVGVLPIDVRNSSEIEHAVAGRGRNKSGMIVTASTLADTHRDMLISLAAKNRMPAVYPFDYYAKSGGLISYGPDLVDPYRRAAGYVDRILKGEKSADLPVQNPTTYRLSINLKTAKTLGLTVPSTLLVRADEVIE